MTIIVRVVVGEWVRDADDCHEHVARSDGYTLGIPLREIDDFASALRLVKDSLHLVGEDEVELTYQWPPWMLGPTWKQAKPIEILDDEDMSLFLAIRADLEEIYLCCRVIRATWGRNVNSYRSDAGGIGGVFTGSNFSLTEIMQIVTSKMNVRVDNANGDTVLTVAELDRLERFDGVGNITAHTSCRGNDVNDNHSAIKCGRTTTNANDETCTMDVTQDQEVTPLPTTRLTAKDKGKQIALDDTSFLSKHPTYWNDYDAFPSTNPLDMWRDFVAAREEFCKATTTTTHIGNKDAHPPGASGVGLDSRGEQGIGAATTNLTDTSLQLRLSGTWPGAQEGCGGMPTQPPIFNLSSTDTSMETPTSFSDSTSETDDDLLSNFEIRPSQPLSFIDDDYMLTPYTTDSDENLGYSTYMPTRYSRLDDVSQNCREPSTRNGTSTALVPCPRDAVLLCEIPVPSMARMRDAAPYFDDPTEEDNLARALKDVEYEGDEIFVGKIFKTKEDCRIKLAIHAIYKKFHFIYAKSCPEMLVGVCVSDSCPWRVYAAKISDSNMFEIRSTTLQHTCSVDARGDFHKQASTAVIGHMMRTRYVGGGRGPRPNELRQILRQEFSLHVSYWKAWRAREIAMDNAMGSAMGSYALIEPYFKLLLETNPNSLVSLETEQDPTGKERFKYLFLSLNASARGYLYMRKVVVIDETHLKGWYGGCLVAASAQDANIQVFPLAFW